MPTAFITGSVSVGKAGCREAGVTCPTASVTTLDGDFMCIVRRTGTYVLTAHAPGHDPAVKKVVVGKLDGRARSVCFKIRQTKHSRG